MAKESSEPATFNVTDVDVDSLGLPTQMNTLEWVKKGAIDLALQTDFNDDEVSLSMPSPPQPLPSEVVHYYADTLEWEENNTSNTDAPNTNADNLESVDYTTIAESEEVPCTQKESSHGQKCLSKFLKLPVERVHDPYLQQDGGAIRLGRQSQILTSDEYLHILEAQEAKKKDIEHLKARKREQLEERKAKRLAEIERKENLKHEREMKRQKMAEDKLQQKQERELKKEQDKLQKEHEKKMKEWQQSQKESDRQQRRLSSPSNPLPDQHHILMELYNTFLPTFASIMNNHSNSAFSPTNRVPIMRISDESGLGQIVQPSTADQPTIASSSEIRDDGQAPPFPGFWADC